MKISFVTEILNQRTKDIELKRNFINILKSTESFQYTLNFLAFVADEIIHEINFHGGNQKLKKEIENVLNTLKSRSQNLLCEMN